MDEIRLLNFTASAIAAMYLWVRFNDLASTAARSWRWVRHGIVLAFVVGSIGSLEHYVHSSELTIAAWTYGLACLVVIAGLWVSRDRKPPASSATK